MLAKLSESRTNKLLRSALVILFILLRTVKNDIMIYIEAAIIVAFIMLSLAALSQKPVNKSPILQKQAETNRKQDIISIAFGLLFFGLVMYSKYF